MKKILLVLLLFFLSAAAAAGFGPILGGGPDGTGEDVEDCPTGTYNFAINFDHGDGNDYACDDSQVTYQKDASGGSYEISSSYGETGEGFRATALDEYIQWDNDFSIDVVDAGTIWMGVYTEAQSSADSVLMELYQDSDDYLYIRMGNGNQPTVFWSGAGTTDFSLWSGSSVSNATWTRIGVTWDQDLGGEDFCVAMDAGSWECDIDNLNAWGSTDAIKLIIGENNSGTTEDDYRLDDIYYIDGFQQSDPHGTY